MYSKLAAPVGETSKALAKLGITVADSAGNMKAPERLFSEILGATAGIKGNVGAMAAMTHLVGLESQKAMLNLAAGAGSGKLEELTSSLKNAAGYAGEIAAKRMNNLEGDFTLLRAAIDGTQQSLYQLKSGALRGVVQGVTEWIGANKGLIGAGVSEFLARATPVVQAFGDAFMHTWPAIKSVFATLGDLAGGSGGWTAALIDAARVLGKLTAVAVGAAGIFGGLFAGALRLGAAQVKLVVDAVEWIPAALGRVVFAVTDFVSNLGAKWERLKADAGLAGAGLIRQLVFGITNGAPMVVFEMEKLGVAAIKAFVGALATPIKAGLDLPGILSEKVVRFTTTALGYDAPVAKTPLEDLSANLDKRFTVPSFDVATTTPLANVVAKAPVINAPSLGADRFAPAFTPVAAAGGFVTPFAAPTVGMSPTMAAASPSPVSASPTAARAEPMTEETLTRAMTAALKGAPERVELTIRDSSGSAEVTKPSKGTKIKLTPSGTF
ncbi:MAG: phage tail tape measure protein [Polyangiaceae bacterium]